MPDYATHPQGPRGNPGPQPTGGGIDIATLFYTAAASAIAAYACSKLWAPGTLAAAAFTPVLVAILKEGLAKSTQVVTRAVPARGVVRSATPEGPRPYDPAAASPYDPAAASPYDPAAQPAAEPFERVPQAGEISYHGGGNHRARNWRLAIVTGLLGFLVCVVVFTVPELVAGGSAAGGGRDTTLFGGEQRDRSDPVVTDTTTTQTQTVTTPPADTVAVPVPPVTTAAPQAPETTPPPDSTTLPPAPQPDAPAVAEPPAAQPPG